MGYFRTAVFKVHDPTGRKVRRVEDMQRQYSLAYTRALNALEKEDEDVAEAFPEMKEGEAKTLLRDMLDDQPLKGAMWDGLYEDLKQTIVSYQATRNASFPVPSSTTSPSIEDLLDELVAPLSRQREEELKAELKRKNRSYRRPILFVRFQDNPIIRSEDGEKLWAAPHFQKGREGGPAYLPEDAESIRPDNWDYSQLRQKNKECLPLEFGRYHLYRFFRKGTPSYSKVRTADGEIYIHYTFEIEAPERARHDPQTDPVLGIDLGEAVVAAYAVVSPTGTVLETGSSLSESLRERLREFEQRIQEVQSNGRSTSDLWEKRRNVVTAALHRISKNIAELANQYGAAIAFEDLRNLGGEGLARQQFNRLRALVRHKAEEYGLRADVEVPPQGTSTTCPKCGHWTKENRGGVEHPELRRDEFQCQNCGYKAHADLNAARMIAIRSFWHLNGGKSGTGCETLSQYTRYLAHERLHPSLSEESGDLKAQLRCLRANIRRLGKHLSDHPEDWEAHQAMDRTLRKKRSIEVCLYQTSTTRID